MTDIFRILIQFATVLFAISIHESAHAWTADKFGDPTARLQGRVTLNPIPHIDLIGTIIFPLILAIVGAPVFGWAKPVMVNPYNLRNRRRDSMFVSAAGPAANIMVALGVIVLLAIFQQPILLSSSASIVFLMKIATNLLLINIFLAVFNLIPIPPLDGSGILEGLLKGEALAMFEKIKPYGFLILLAIIYTHVLDVIANFIFTILFKLFPFLIFIMMKAGAVS
ncbi:site-2 protease family protein [candidate division KSB1 bacterium]|nr:site-2 protease family protein [Candidatus Aminicenantes bacterium]RQW03616.1 MAG: site-2 protease family protein [candidate division KSB1 bacterium]